MFRPPRHTRHLAHMAATQRTEFMFHITPIKLVRRKHGRESQERDWRHNFDWDASRWLRHLRLLADKLYSTQELRMQIRDRILWWAFIEAQMVGRRGFNSQ